MKNARPLLFGKIFEMVVDFLLILLAFCVAYFARIGLFFSTDFAFLPYFSEVLSVAPVFILLLERILCPRRRRVFCEITKNYFECARGNDGLCTFFLFSP